MKKVAILTITSINYGNRLQNYALQEIIMKLGYDVCTLQRERKNITERFKRRLRKYLKKDKLNLFYRFDKNINWSNKVISSEYISLNVSKYYDMFVIGSDQIWNIDFDFISDVDFLPMIETNKKVSYAASFGVSYLDKKEEERIGNMLKKIKMISVRENSGVDIVRSSSNREARVVLDPTLLLTAKEWEKIEKRPVFDLPDNYLVKYFLGDIEKDTFINEFAKDKGLAIIDLMDKNILVGPAEFVYLIHHSKMVCTDSFHASVFSFIFEKPFIIFERVSKDKDMSSRIDTLCNTFKLNNHRFNSEQFDLKSVINVNYSESKNILLEKQKESIDYLKLALNS